VHACTSTQEVEARGSWVQDLPGLQRDPEENKLYFLLFFAILGFELRAYTL
jgi:hypothetical protein